MIGELPTGLYIGEKYYAIRSDYRDVLSIIEAFNDPELENIEKLYICLFILFKDFKSIPTDMYMEAYEKAMWFIDCGEKPSDKKKSKNVMDWQQDERLLFPAVNKVAGFEVRSRKYLHWWTFMGYFMEIKDGMFSQVLALRQKKASGKKLEKAELEFWAANKDICVIQPRLTKEEQEEKDRLNAMLT